MNDNLVSEKAKAKATLVLKNLDNFGSDWLTVYEVAEYLRCDHTTVRKLIKQGDLDTARLVPGKILISIPSLRKFLEQRKNLGTDSRFAPKNWNGGRREGNQYTDPDWLK